MGVVSFVIQKLLPLSSILREGSHTKSLLLSEQGYSLPTQGESRRKLEQRVAEASCLPPSQQRKAEEKGLAYFTVNCE